MSRKNDVGDPMLIRLQISHRLMILPSLINANYWTLSRTTMTSIGMQINKLLELCVIEESQASEWSQAHPVPKGDGQ
jgi:hypothetical protein